MPLKKDKHDSKQNVKDEKNNNDDSQIQKNEYISIKHILLGKALFAITLIVFLGFVPGHVYGDFFGLTIIGLVITGLITRFGWITTSTNLYLIYGLAGYASALWILSITQAFGD